MSEKEEGREREGEERERERGGRKGGREREGERGRERQLVYYSRLTCENTSPYNCFMILYVPTNYVSTYNTSQLLMDQ